MSTIKPYRGEHFGVFSSNGDTYYVAGIDASGSHYQGRGSLEIEQANEWALAKDSVYASTLARGGSSDGRWSATSLADEAASQVDCPEIE